MRKAVTVNVVFGCVVAFQAVADNSHGSHTTLGTQDCGSSWQIEGSRCDRPHHVNAQAQVLAGTVATEVLGRAGRWPGWKGDAR